MSHDAGGERKLGRAILYEHLRRLGVATVVLVKTNTHRSPTLDLYESGGFEPIRDVLV